MNHISKLHEINKTMLVRGDYFQSLLAAAADAGAFDNDGMIRVQTELMALLKKQVFRFTSGDSTSVRVETAKALMQSIYYGIGAYLKTIPDVDEQIDILKQKSLESLLWQGIDITHSCVAQAKKILEHIQENALKVNNQAYHDTIFKGIPPFFQYYDADFSATDSPGSIDYPLSSDYMDINGAEYIYEYLLHLAMENDFCRRFPDETMIKLLRGYSRYYSRDLINIYEIVLGNVLGLSILGKPVYDLQITGQDREKLFQTLNSLPSECLQDYLENEFLKVCSMFQIEDRDTIQYLKSCIGSVSSRIKHNLENGSLDYIFVSLKEKEEKLGKTYYDGQKMEDQKLRLFIDEMKECRHTSDKILMIKQNVKSLADLSEILKECFFGDEADEVYKLLSKEEYEELKKCMMDNSHDIKI